MNARVVPVLVLLAACGSTQRHAATTPERAGAVETEDASRLFADGASALRHATPKSDVRAEKLLRRAIAADPGLWQAHHDLGVLALRRGRQDAARAHFAEAHARAPQEADPALALADLDPARGADALREVLARDPANQQVRLALAATLRARGAVDDAMAEARTALRAQPSALAPLLELARCERAAKRPKLAQLVLDRAETVAGPNAAIENERGLLALDDEELPDALAHFARAVALDARFTPAHVNQATLLLRAGDAPGAERAYRAALRADPGGSGAADVRVGLAVTLRAQNQHRAAQREYERILATWPDHPAASFDLGVLLADFLDQRSQAIAPFERYLASTPADDPHRARAERYLRDLRMSVGGPAP